MAEEKRVVKPKEPVDMKMIEELDFLENMEMYKMVHDLKLLEPQKASTAPQAGKDKK